MKKYILALDQGTTSSRAIVFDHNGLPVASAQSEFRQIFPQPGWVEHDAMEIWTSQAMVALDAIKKTGIDSKSIDAIGVTNQRETTVIWNRKTGKPVCNAIVWQDRRTSGYCDQLKNEGAEDMVRTKTGLVLDAYFSATKIKWILDNVDGARDLAQKGLLAFGTIDSWLLWNLTSGKLHITDVTNASRTMLFNIHKLEWDAELLNLFNIPASMLPEVKPSSAIYGSTAAVFETRIPVCGIAGDQQAALFGQMCIRPGMVKNTYGTGCFMVMNVGSEATVSGNNLLTTIAWQLDGKTTYALEGSIFIAGAVVQWLRDGLGIIGSSSQVEELAAKTSHNEGVYFVPAFAGLGAPHWNQHARGMLMGLTRGSTASHIARAALESIAYQTYDVLQAMKADSGIPIRGLRVDGGAAVNNLLMQFQCDLLGVEVSRPQVTETTALGAAYLAGLASGFWNELGDLEKHWQLERKFTPAMPESDRRSLVEGWNKAVKTALSWTE